MLEKGVYRNCDDWGAGNSALASLQPVLQVRAAWWAGPLEVGGACIREAPCRGGVAEWARSSGVSGRGPG